jgi:hypothetical protein
VCHRAGLNAGAAQFDRHAHAGGVSAYAARGGGDRAGAEGARERHVFAQHVRTRCHTAGAAAAVTACVVLTRARSVDSPVFTRITSADCTVLHNTLRGERFDRHLKSSTFVERQKRTDAIA